MDFLQGHTSIARLLVENGANVDAKTQLDRTPLFEAAVYGTKLPSFLPMEEIF